MIPIALLPNYPVALKKSFMNLRLSGLLTVVFVISSLVPKAFGQIPSCDQFNSTQAEIKAFKNFENLQHLLSKISYAHSLPTGITSLESCVENWLKSLEKVADAKKKDFSQNAKFWNLHGDLKWHLKKFSQARDSYLKAVDLDVAHIAANVSLGKYYLERKDFNLALKHFRRAIVGDAKDQDERKAQVWALTELLSGLEEIPERAFEAEEKLQKLARVSDRMYQLLAKLALKFGDLEKAQSYIQKLNVPDQIPFQIEIYKKEGRSLLWLEALKKGIEKKSWSDSQVKKNWIQDYFELAKSLRNWVELRHASVLCLKEWKAREECLRALDTTLSVGVFLDGSAKPNSRLNEALSLLEWHPQSLRIQEIVLWELLGPIVKGIKSESFDAPHFRRAAAHVDRLLSLDSRSFDARYWSAFLHFKRKEFREADLRWDELRGRMKIGESMKVKIENYDFWRWPLECKRELGYESLGQKIIEELPSFGVSESDQERLGHIFRSPNPKVVGPKK